MRPALLLALSLTLAAPAAAQARRADSAPAADAPAAARQYVIDQSHSAVTFKVRHLGISTVSGRFAKFGGTFSYDSTAPALAAVDVTIDAASIDTDIDRRDAHLRSEDFFFVERHPSITFVGRNIQKVEGNRYQVLGDLTMRGVTRPVVLDAEVTGILRMANGTEVVAVEATATINRFDYGLTWNRMTEGVANVAPEVQIVLSVQARGAPQATP